MVWSSILVKEFKTWFFVLISFIDLGPTWAHACAADHLVCDASKSVMFLSYPCVDHPAACADPYLSKAIEWFKELLNVIDLMAFLRTPLRSR